MTLEFPYIAVIPFKVMSDPDLPPNAKLHYGCLAGLSKKEGYCWATNEQLAEMHGVHESQIKRWQKELEEKGFIRRVQENKPFRDEEGKMLWRTERKIYVNDGFSANCGQRKNAPPDGQRKNALPDGQRKNAPLNKESLKEEIHKERKGSASPPRSRSISKKIKRREHVHTSADEHEKLINSHGEERVEKFYNRLQEWKEDTPKSKWKKCDYRSILRWVVDAITEEKLKEQKRQKADQGEDNVAYAKRIVENFMEIEAPRKQISLEATNQGLIIYSTHPTSTRPQTLIKFRENGFKDQVNNALRSWRLT